MGKGKFTFDRMTSSTGVFVVVDMVANVRRTSREDRVVRSMLRGEEIG